MSISRCKRLPASEIVLWRIDYRESITEITKLDRQQARIAHRIDRLSHIILTKEGVKSASLSPEDDYIVGYKWVKSGKDKPSKSSGKKRRKRKGKTKPKKRNYTPNDTVKSLFMSMAGIEE